MQAYNKKAQQVVQLQRTTPIPRQLLSMALDLGYPTVTQGHRLTDLTPIARTKQTQYSTRPKPTIPQLIVWKVHAAHDCEHGYHDSLHSAEVAQLYPQVDDFIAS
jgi:hypothetical protein